ncbi:hypothetical protein pdam_00023270 [Pocillopora damicornis]|uniref:Uncharacterized protein n=1 Tax=Pocillopora damicornis TaxID=46731 RepID=A0A3M6TYY6_POCDA|nr:hypothetical protein pdam_00023270 [Pocillopora damicornis]
MPCPPQSAKKHKRFDWFKVLGAGAGEARQLLCDVMAPRAGKPLFQAVVDHEQKFKTDSQPTHLNTYISHLKIRAEFLYSVGNARIETTPASPAPA